MKHQYIVNKRGQGLAEIIVILVVLTFILLVSVRIIKKNVSTEDAVTDDQKQSQDISPSSSPAKIILDVKEKVEQTNTTIPGDLEEEANDEEE